MHLLMASNNQSKVARVRKLLAPFGVRVSTPAEVGIDVVDVREGSDIFKNALMKARAYAGKTDLPILSNDASFTLDGVDHDPAQVRRNALLGKDERAMTQETIAEAMISYYQQLVADRGAPIPGVWEDCFVLSLPNGSMLSERSLRPILLTGVVTGAVNAYFPLRSLYIVGPTGKYSSQQTEEDEAVELQPITEALKRLLQLS